MTWRISSAMAAAQLQATLDRANAGAGNSRVQLFATTLPPLIGQGTDTPMAEVILAKPCGAIIDGALTLYPLDANGSVVAADGIPRWAQWLAADGAVLADGTVTDASSGGDFQVAGGTTPPGDNSPALYAGGLVQLGATALT